MYEAVALVSNSLAQRNNRGEWHQSRKLDLVLDKCEAINP